MAAPGIANVNNDGSVVDANGYSWPSMVDYNTYYGTSQPSTSSGPSPADIAAVNQMNNNPNADWTSLTPYGKAVAQNNLQYNLPNLYGFAMSGPPAPGTPTLAGSTLAGMFQGNPTLAAEEAGGQFGPNMGYLAGRPTLAAEEALGTINGSPTLAGQEAFGYSNGAAGTGTRTLGGQQLDYGTAMDAMKLLGSLQSNPFAMERVARGIDSTGIPNALKGLMQGGAIPGFQAPQAKPQAPSLTGSLGIQNPSQGQGGGPATADPNSPDFDPAAVAGVNVDATNAAAPAPNKLNAVSYTSAAPSVQSFIKSLYQSLGYNPDTIDEQAKAALPGFTAPRYGTVMA